MRDADVFGQIIVGSKTQTRNRVQIAVARCEKYNGQSAGQRTELTTHLESPLDFVAETDIQQDQIGQAGVAAFHGAGAIAVRRNPVAVLAEHAGVVLAQGVVVFDDEDMFGHGC